MRWTIMSYRIRNSKVAYADMLSRVYSSDTLRAMVGALEGRDYAQLSNQSGMLFNIEAWWYLVFRTCNAEGAIAVARFCSPAYHGVADAAAVDAIFNGYANPDAVNDAFEACLLTLGNWWETGYADIIADGVGPWPTGDD